MDHFWNITGIDTRRVQLYSYLAKCIARGAVNRPGPLQLQNRRRESSLLQRLAHINNHSINNPERPTVGNKCRYNLSLVLDSCSDSKQQLFRGANSSAKQSNHILTIPKLILSSLK